MRSLLEVNNLEAGYGRVSVLKDISLKVEAGTIVTVIGPNGAGKTTLLNALAGLLDVGGGTVSLEGSDITRHDTEDRIYQGMGLVTEQRNLFSTMTVQDNLWLGAFSRRGRAGRDELVEEAYRLFPRLRERKLQTAGTLSGGERQMLALGRAFLARPRLLMLDEPSLGLAPLVVRDTLETVGRLRDQGISVLLVEQNARAALKVADYGYVLENGAISLQGPASDLLTNPAVAASYLGGSQDEARAAATTEQACS
ncbi:ABC transporter ATP-binding protein [Pusillimonas noertemannii]|uniref:Branched-chain amino acid transport system ATP-binding protein n=1 Tax=Pusillimonas noertemannii TaxID=305977 RepID=A0A2U1CNF7_9BURK|nr:ABC transporter ATP-binding protein [Pusillimonas noertemannii]NYT68434.1 ABC transporter ATP-binding protein [Pusillimonas noertemannii]PVY62549.1 branched-chain amino acid transport system ATP-binding protein [Pusillimonas noertemannii]